MKRTILITAFAFIAGSLAAADARDEVKAAAKKLAEKGNYSWKSNVESPGGGGGGGGKNKGRGFGTGPSEGKFDKGVMLITTTRGENTTEAVLKDGKGAIKTQDGWQSLAELAQGDAQNVMRFVALRYRNQKAPAADVEDLAGKTKELKKSDDGYSGDLTEDGAKSLLSFGGGGGKAPSISNPKGSVTFWVKDGIISKYQIKVEGSMSFNGNDININRTTTVEIKDIGSTKIEIPEGAKNKIS
jgi:hypothetical protein